MRDSLSPPNLPLQKGGTDLLAKHMSTLLHSFTPTLLILDEKLLAKHTVLPLGKGEVEGDGLVTSPAYHEDLHVSFL